MLVSRFLLDLQEAHQRKVVLLGSSSLLDSSSSLSSWVAFGSSHAHSGSQGASGTLVFATAGTLGALGASIDPEDWRDAEDPYEEEEGARDVVLAFPTPRCDGDLDNARLEDVDGGSPPHSPPWTECKALLDGQRVG